MNDENDRYRTATVSVIDPLSRAIDWTRQVLFRPFSLEKWIVLGFCAWLAMLGEGAGGSSNWSHGGDGDDFERSMRHAWEWVLEHLIPILFIAGVVLIVLVALWLLFRWLSSRGKFMFLDGVVHDRAAVVEPWHRFRGPANSLFGLRIVLDILGLIVIGGFVAFVIFSVLLFVGTHDLEPLLIAAVVFGVICIVVVALCFALVELVIIDFLVPVMYLRQCSVGPAWRELRELLGARPGAFVLYVLVKVVIAIVVTILFILACCMTCCVVLIPYVGTVILLPLWVFVRAYPLYFLGQFGPAYARFATLGPAGPEIAAPTRPPGE